MHKNLLYTLFFSCFLVISSFSVEPNYYLLLKGSSSFAESFITAEWLYSSMKRAKAIDLTTIGTGYFKCIEQLLFNLDKGLLISLCSLTARNGYEVIFRLQQH